MAVSVKLFGLVEAASGFKRLRLTAGRRMTVRGWVNSIGCVVSAGFVVSTGLVISTEGRNLVLGGLRSLPALEMTGHNYR